MIEKPIFIVGCGRSGSTAFFERFSKHHQLSWPTGFVNKFAGRIPLAMKINWLSMKAIDIPGLGEWLQNRFWLGGGEVYPAWEKFHPNFAEVRQDLTGADVSDTARAGLPPYFAQTLTRRRQRFMTKITGWPRLGYLYDVFPDARFIHVLRDGRAVANSFMNVFFWRGREGPDNWRWGPLSPEQQQRWEATGKETIALAGLNWEILADSMELARNQIPESQFLEVRYEDMCREPETVFEKVNRFCELDDSPRMQRFMDKKPLRNTNDKYKKLPPDQVEILESILKPSLARHGYA